MPGKPGANHIEVMSMARVGILGGSFNPVHSGHVRLAVVVRDRLGLDAVELVPAGVPPHKRDERLLPFADRAELCRAAVAEESGLSVNPMEGDRPGPSYTIDTLRQLAGERPDDSFTFILGLGDFRNLGHWVRGLELVRHADLAVAARPGDDADGQDEPFSSLVGSYWPEAGVPGHAAGPDWRVGGHRVRYVEGDFLAVSSSQVRARWLAGEPVADLVPQAVADWLTAHADRVRAAWSA